MVEEYFLFFLRYYRLFNNYWTGVACPWKKWMSRCWTCRTRTPATSSTGSQIMLRRLCVTYRRVASRWVPRSSATLLLFRSCSNAYLNSFRPCSTGRHSCIGTPAREWTKWSSPKQSPTWTIWFPNTNSIRCVWWI